MTVRGHVFIGGYFYDPYFGPYPWWDRAAYPYWYSPVYDRRAELRLQVTPEDTAVYVDGFYAGIVDDFDGFFQALPLPPGGHSIVLFLDGYRTVRHNIYLRPDSTFRLRNSLQRLPAGHGTHRLEVNQGWVPSICCRHRDPWRGNEGAEREPDHVGTLGNDGHGWRSRYSGTPAAASSNRTPAAIGATDISRPMAHGR